MPAITTSARVSYGIMAVLFVLVGWLHVGTLLLTVLFGYFALNFFSFGRSKTLGSGPSRCGDRHLCLGARRQGSGHHQGGPR